VGKERHDLPPWPRVWVRFAPDTFRSNSRPTETSDDRSSAARPLSCTWHNPGQVWGMAPGGEGGSGHQGATGGPVSII